jgi:DNA-binding response OmpR family regulator
LWELHINNTLLLAILQAMAQPAATYAPRGTAARILVVDDDPSARDLLRRVLERNGMEPLLAESATSGLRTLFQERPDLVLLDIGLPDLDGRAALDRIRELTDVPVVIVSAQDAEEIKVSALRAGADDYVTKPVGLQELIARIDALLRRTAAPAQQPAEAYSDGLVHIDHRSLEVLVGGKPIDLTALELRLLMTLVEHPNQVLSADQILHHVWGDSTLSRDRVKLYIGYLRAKFRSAGADAPIETLRGFGYRYRPPAG